ncbi:GNAT family N-acetyltransferase [Martelella radicis]|uniref:Ribosomal protein S18 acetylase RimI-like enzyme n=1 Tax=Martelella radicis TaxID=1397476 RepID=A0A7W6P9H0_9HYPH|nr:GNAT family N-acetyltransferase [Martelella radicis]MBB4122257.1 ribosomal protein S18 acetylase RimI-like enzyme [Martelella radicis]
MFFVRTAMETDIPAVCALLSETWHATYDEILGPEKVETIVNSWLSHEAVLRRLRRPHGEFLVADSGTMIGGMAFAAPDKNNAEIVNLSQLYVLPGCQRQGIGQQLFAEIETCFPNAKRLALEVLPQNASAIRFYEAHGMREVGRHDECGAPGSGIPAIRMEKDLPGV